MIPDVDRVLVEGFVSWIESAGEDESEQEARMVSVEHLLFDGVDGAEKERVEALWRSATSGRKKKPAELPSPVATPAPTAAEKRNRRKRSSIKLYDPARSGYMRATREEGLGHELLGMRAASMGSPLYSDGTPAGKPAGGSELDRVRRLLGSMKKK